MGLNIYEMLMFVDSQGALMVVVMSCATGVVGILYVRKNITLY